MGAYTNKVNEIGTCLHWWRFHSATPDLEPDVGTDPDTDFNDDDGTTLYTAQVAGPLTSETSYGVAFTDAVLVRSAGLTTNDWGSVTTGSITFWVKSSSATNQIIWAGHPDNKGFLFWLLADGTFQFQVIDGANSTTIVTVAPGSGGTDWSDGAWHFVALTCDGAASNKLYVDGFAVTVNQSTGGAGLGNFPWIGSLTDDSTSVFYVGNSNRYDAGVPVDQPFVGSISDLGFWSGALTAANVLALYNAGTQAPAGAGGDRYNYRRTFPGF